MKNPKYREAMADLYRLLEEFEDTPAVGSEGQEIYWERCSQAFKAAFEKYMGYREIHEWIMGIYNGFDVVSKRKRDEMQ